MEFVNLILLPPPSKSYCYENASSISMCILGRFLTDDVYHPSSYIEYIFNDWEEYTSSNATALQKEGNYVLFTDLYPQEETPIVLKMTREQFINILTDWEEKVLKLKPKEVLIKYENNEFVIKTKN